MDPREMQKGSTPRQRQLKQPGIEAKMEPLPAQPTDYQGTGKLKGKSALITGGDSGIGRAVSILYAKEGANVAISYLDEHEDAEETKRMVEAEGVQCLLLPGDIKEEAHCSKLVEKTVEAFGKLNILVNNAAIQYVREDLLDISSEQFEEVFRVNFFSQFYTTKAAVRHMKAGDAIISTSSINAYRGNPIFMDYSATKGAITAFTRSIAQSLAKKGIRANTVAPGPVWTPLIPSSFDEDGVENFGQDSLMGRPGQPSEHAWAYVMLAADESSYMTGQAIHINGGSWISS
ncbi:SDR family oxidoreductase [Virgibacillus dakarensis]|uniref:Oxidoreductase YhdF n=1 Tax=Lentibacillus populi TaxID=1827502 RepID=A0A9W5U1V8_9BACI|nr:MULTISPECIES: SDR family oxidoreductase [Bacillaceae]MBT2216452.1 SDR family oxidoreductase [Virgibacillus dakarensis]MTW85852.1 SDR family oxidoreductase [Virgibacillus dakarensis]GGB59982.1 putative oxidoreductase YhdF [Lentibacillus populi]